MGSVLQDIKYAVRRLGRSKGFTFTAVFILAVAIGANTTIFTLVDALLLRSIPGVGEPEQLVSLTGAQSSNQSYPNYLDFQQRVQAFSGLVAYRATPMDLGFGTENRRVWGYEATGNYFRVLGVRPALGRFFTPAEDQKAGGDPYAVLSYAAWQRWFGGDPKTVSRPVRINGLSYTILGVAPKGFIGTELLYAPAIWVPMSMETQIEPGNHWLLRRDDRNVWITGRLKPTISKGRAQSELDTVSAQLSSEYPTIDGGMHVLLAKPGLSLFRRPLTEFLATLTGVAGMVLLIACINLASFLLARSTDRQKETAIRIALGAGRLRLIRQHLTESALLAAAGGGAGILAAWWATDLISASRFPIDIPLTAAVALDGRVLGFAIGASVLTVLLFGLTPAMQATWPDPAPALKREFRPRTLRRWELRELLVAAQVSLSVLLLVASALVVRSLQNALAVNLGFNSKHAAAVSFDLGLQGYSQAQARKFRRELRQRVQALPGIKSASVADHLPLSLAPPTTWIAAYGQPVPRPNERIRAVEYHAGPNFFHTMQTRILEGRDFSERDTPGSQKVVIIDQALANRLFPHRDALGEKIRRRSDGPWFTIVGITENGKYQSLNDTRQPAVFWPLSQTYSLNTTLVARSPLPANALIATLRKAVHQMDPTVPIYAAGTLEQHLLLPLTPARVAASVLGSFGFLAVVLAAAGIYGSMAYSVARRTREIGIRVALGATRQNVLKLVLSRAAIVLAAGICVGLAAALATGDLFRAVLYGISPMDPLTYIVAVLLMIAVGLLAAFTPAQRAVRIDPTQALREE